MKTAIKYLLIGFGIGVAFTLTILTILDSNFSVPFYNRYEIVNDRGTILYKLDRYTGKTWQKQFKDYSWREIKHKQ